MYEERRMNRILFLSDQTQDDPESKIFVRRTNRCLIWFLAVPLFTFIIGLLLFLLFGTNCAPTPYTHSLSNIKQIATSTVIYTSDYDDVHPNATSMPSLRAMVYPYLKNRNLFLPIHQKSASPSFNFNVAGVENFAIPIGQIEPLQSFQSVVWYATVTSSNSYGVVMSSFDTGSRHVSTDKFLKYCQPQFLRKATLAPANYLNDQDPVNGDKNE